MTARVDAVREADVVVLGAGAAGLSVALGLAGRRRRPPGQGPAGPDAATAPGRRAASPAPWGGTTRPRCTRADTLAVAGELGDPEAVERLTSEGPDRLSHLLALGARFDRDETGQLDLAREAAHSRAPRPPRPGRHGGRGRARARRAARRAERPLRLRALAGARPGAGRRPRGRRPRPARGRRPRAPPRPRGRARHRRHRPALRADHQPARGHGRRPRARLARRRAPRRPRVRPVPPDRPRRRSRPDAAAHRGPARRGGDARRRRRPPAARRRRAAGRARCRGTSSPGRSGPRWPRAAARSSTRATRWGRPSPSGSRRSSRPAASTASTRGASRSPWPRPPTTTWAAWTWTSTGARASPGLWAAGRGGLHGRPRREPPGQQLAPRRRSSSGRGSRAAVGEALPHLRRPAGALDAPARSPRRTPTTSRPRPRLRPD